jgi:biopolymer transport protein ExbD
MIDVVFLLLIFFMLASKFGITKAIQIPLAGSTRTNIYKGPPRLVEVGNAQTFLNGFEIRSDKLANALGELSSDYEAPVILRGRDKATVQDLLNIFETLKGSGFKSVVIVE